MRYRALILALVFGLSANFLSAEEEKDRRVRAKKPTVVTVEGKIEQVETERESEQRSLGAKIAGAVKTGAVKTWQGLGDFAGWMFHVDQDVPAKRDRIENGKQEK